MLVRLAGRPEIGSGDPGVKELPRQRGYLPLAIGMLASQLRHVPLHTLDFGGYSRGQPRP
jgi:hypothetical protein